MDFEFVISEIYNLAVRQRLTAKQISIRLLEHSLRMNASARKIFEGLAEQHKLRFEHDHICTTYSIDGYRLPESEISRDPEIREKIRNTGELRYKNGLDRYFPDERTAEIQEIELRHSQKYFSRCKDVNQDNFCEWHRENIFHLLLVKYGWEYRNTRKCSHWYRSKRRDAEVIVAPESQLLRVYHTNNRVKDLTLVNKAAGNYLRRFNK